MIDESINKFLVLFELIWGIKQIKHDKILFYCQIKYFYEYVSFIQIQMQNQQLLLYMYVLVFSKPNSRLNICQSPEALYTCPVKVPIIYS